MKEFRKITQKSNKLIYMSHSNNSHFKYLFGPVPSRRLGISLGVDMVPFKTCSLDCVYCESGKTTLLTIERKKYISPEKVIEELAEYLSYAPVLDYITFSGSGEPLLNSGISEVIRYLKTNHPQYLIALLTNGTLFFDQEVINDVLDMDLIVASLDAVTGSIFEKINRPHKTLNIDKVVEGLVKLRRVYKNELWLEIFIVPGINDSETELDKINMMVKEIGADKIQLNSLDRPGTENWVAPLAKTRLAQISEFLNSAEVIDKVELRREKNKGSFDIKERIISMVRRRPCTTDDIVESTGIYGNEINKHLAELIEQKIIISEKMDRGVFFKIR